MVKRKTRGFWSRKKIAYFAIAGTLVWALVAYEIPLWWYGQAFIPTETYGNTGTTYTLHEPDEPPVSYQADFTFTGTGALALGGNIHFVAVVYNVNITDFTDHFIGIFFSNALTPVTGTPGTPQSQEAFALFHTTASGTWRAEGDMAFVPPLNFTGPVLIPKWVTNGTFSPDEFVSPASAQVKAYNFRLPLQSQDVANSIVAQEIGFRFDATAASLSILAVGTTVAVSKRK